MRELKRDDAIELYGLHYEQDGADIYETLGELAEGEGSDSCNSVYEPLYAAAVRFLQDAAVERRETSARIMNAPGVSRKDREIQHELFMRNAPKNNLVTLHKLGTVYLPDPFLEPGMPIYLFPDPGDSKMPPCIQGRISTFALKPALDPQMQTRMPHYNVDYTILTPYSKEYKIAFTQEYWERTPRTVQFAGKPCALFTDYEAAAAHLRQTTGNQIEQALEKLYPLADGCREFDRSALLAGKEGRMAEYFSLLAKGAFNILQKRLGPGFWIIDGGLSSGPAREPS
jgi:hypothetical protein